MVDHFSQFNCLLSRPISRFSGSASDPQHARSLQGHLWGLVPYYSTFTEKMLLPLINQLDQSRIRYDMQDNDKELGLTFSCLSVGIVSRRLTKLSLMWSRLFRSSALWCAFLSAYSHDNNAAVLTQLQLGLHCLIQVINYMLIINNLKEWTHLI